MKRQIPKQIYPILFLIDTLNGHMGSSEVKNDDFLNVPDEPCIWTFTIMRYPFWNSSYAFEFLHWEGIRTEIFKLIFWPSMIGQWRSIPVNRLGSFPWISRILTWKFQPWFHQIRNHVQQNCKEWNRNNFSWSLKCEYFQS